MAPGKTEKKAKPKELSGAAKIAAAGKVGVLLALTPEEKAWVEKGAKLDSRTQSQFLVFHAVQAAKKLSRKIPAKP